MPRALAAWAVSPVRTSAPASDPDPHRAVPIALAPAPFRKVRRLLRPGSSLCDSAFFVVSSGLVMAYTSRHRRMGIGRVTGRARETTMRRSALFLYETGH